VLEKDLLDKVKPLLSSIKPRKAVFDRNYVKMLMAGTSRRQNKLDLAEQVSCLISANLGRVGAARLVMIWCGSTEVFLQPTAIIRT